MNGTCPCGNPLPPKHHKYCSKHCASKASLLWKREQRRACRASRSASEGSIPYWLEPWHKLTGNKEAAVQAYRAYMRADARGYRARRRAVHGE